MMFMVDITIVHGVYKVTYTWGASSWGNIAEQTRGNINSWASIVTRLVMDYPPVN